MANWPHGTAKPPASVPEGALAALREAVGSDRVEVAEDRRVFFGTDMSRRGSAPVAIVRPGSAEDLAAILPICAAHRLSAIPRGGGFSYTGGYVPVNETSLVVDLRDLDRVIEINKVDMYVVVETGCTWNDLYQALKEQGLRTPYFGPMSGYGATVGGALSQGSFFLGSSQFGPAAESVLALEVVLASGESIRTGSWGAVNDATPFFRSYGPDLTGLFLGDTGAMGFKTKAALKLIPFPDHSEFASFAFSDEGDAIASLSAISRAAIAAECYCWDPYFVRIMSAASETLGEDLKFLAGIAKGGGSVGRGLFNAVRVALSGKSVFREDVFILNATIDDVSRAGAEAKLRILRAIAGRHRAVEIPPSAPMAMRGTPFVNFNTSVRRRPLRNLPTHGIAPHSRVGAVSRDIRGLLSRHRARMEDLGLDCGVVYFGVGAQAVCMEPLIYWEDLEHFNHDRVEERSDLNGLGEYDERPPGTQLAAAIRAEMTEIFTRHGCAHVQIGKSYPWLRTRQPAVADLVAGIKRLVDPDNRVNPGSLGLGGP